MADTRFPYGYSGNPQGMGVMLTWDQMMTKSTVNRLHPEMRRRFKAMIEAAAKAGHPLGVGTGWRIQPPKKPGFASPGNSYHEGFPANGVAGNALAVDTVPNVSWPWMEANSKKYGLRTFRNVGSEPWHVQPIEISTSRHYATTCPPLQTFNLPGTPVIDVPRPVLKSGSSGAEVTQLIDALKFWKWYPNVQDVNNGKFGSRTDVGVRNMQKALKITVDGVYGSQTAAAYKKFLEAMASLSG